MRNTINSDTITAAILWGMGNLIMLFLINELTQRIEDFAALSTVDVAKMLALAGVFFLTNAGLAAFYRYVNPITGRKNYHVYVLIGLGGTALIGSLLFGLVG